MIVIVSTKEVASRGCEAEGAADSLHHLGFPATWGRAADRLTHHSTCLALAFQTWVIFISEDSKVGKDPESEETILAGRAAAIGGDSWVSTWHWLAWHLPTLHPILRTVALDTWTAGVEKSHAQLMHYTI